MFINRYLVMFHLTQNHANAVLTKDPGPMPLRIGEPITDALDLDQEMLGLLRQLSLCILLLPPQDQIGHPRTAVLVIFGKVLEDSA